MPVLNYTTQVEVAKTVGEIHGILSRHGARQIVTDYDAKGAPTGLTFALDTALGRQAFRLPANIAGIWALMEHQYQDGRLQRRFATPEQAARVAWRIVKDWLEAQLALIEADMVSVDQVLLPYMIVDRNSRQTLYEAMIENQGQLPPPREAGK